MSEQKLPAQQEASRPIDGLKKYLNVPSVQEQFKNAMKDSAPLFVASIIDLFSQDKGLQRCSAPAIITECLKAAVLKLPISKSLGFAWVIPYDKSQKLPDGSWTKVAIPTFQIGYKGYIQLAMRTGQYRTINADVVYEGELGAVDKLTGFINFDGERKSDKAIGYFCHFALLNGFSKTLYMTTEQVHAHAKTKSPSYKQKGGVWETDFDSMALKTVIRLLLSKYGYLSVEMQSAMDSDVEPQEQQIDAIIQKGANSQAIDIDFKEASEEDGASQSDTEPEPPTAPY